MVCHFFLQGDLPNPGIKPRSPALQAGSLPTELPGKPVNDKKHLLKQYVGFLLLIKEGGEKIYTEKVWNVKPRFFKRLCLDYRLSYR